jgi:hypothetical protein
VIPELGTYSWQVQAIDGAFLGGPWSATGFFNIEFTFDDICLAVARPFADGHQALDLSWNNSCYAESGYEIEWSADGTAGSWTHVHTTAPDATSWRHAGLGADTERFYRARAAFPIGYSPYSNTAHHTTYAAASGPSGLTATPGALPGSGIDVAWTDNAVDETHYRVEWATNAGGPWTTLAELPVDATAFTDASVAGGTVRFYRAYAVRGAEDSNVSNQASATAP